MKSVHYKNDDTVTVEMTSAEAHQLAEDTGGHSSASKVLRNNLKNLLKPAPSKGDAHARRA